MPRRVIKLGGSLLDWHDFPAKFRIWDQAQSAAQRFLIVGGGDVVEAIRTLDRVHSFSRSDIHWLCVGLLDATWKLACELLPDWQPIETPLEFRNATQSTSNDNRNEKFLVRVKSYYDRGIVSQNGLPELPALPEDWSTTTDALAVYLGGVISAAEIILLKSCPVDQHSDLHCLAKQGQIDAATPIWMDKWKALHADTTPVSVKCVNLRDIAG